jgi:hypothetical protein
MLDTLCRKLADEVGLSLNSRLARGLISLILALVIAIAAS